MIGLQACIDHAASGYHIPPAYIETVMKAAHLAEGIGPMGISPSWLPTLARYGFNIRAVMLQECANIDAGAWIIAANPRAQVSPETPVTVAGGDLAPLPVCGQNAEVTYHVPDPSIRAVLRAAHAGGSYGPMGVPTAWLPLLTAYGFNSYMVEHDACTGLVAGIWILGVERLDRYGGGNGEGAYNATFSTNPPAELIPLYKRAATHYSLPIDLLFAVSAQESGFFPEALSPAGAMGLMQLMPGTARQYGVINAFDPAQNIMGAAAYLADLEVQFGRNLPLVLAAYNAGSGAVTAYGDKIPPYAETQSYVPTVLGRLKFYEQHYLPAAAKDAGLHGCKTRCSISF